MADCSEQLCKGVYQSFELNFVDGVKKLDQHPVIF
jgi:hypothetical protein